MQKKPTFTGMMDPYKAVWDAGDNAYHFVRSLQENKEEDVLQATARDIRSENPKLSVVDAQLYACIEVKCMQAAASGNGRAKRVREALKERRQKQQDGIGMPDWGLDPNNA